jgi:D-alanine-D-alanine ligase-like ATP-grasp enzyme
MNEKIFKLLVLPSVHNMQQVIDRFPFPIELTKGHFKNLEFILQNGQAKILHGGLDIREFSFVWLCSSWGYRDLAYAIQLYLKKYKVPFTQVEKGTSKITDHTIFSLNKIPAPDTLFIARKEVEKNLSQIRNICGYPLVVKDVKGSRGSHSVMVETEEDLLQKIGELPKHKKFLFQKYIPNIYDWGIMVADGVVVSGQRRYPCEGEFRNNICMGGEEVFFDPAKIPDHIKQLAIRTSNALGLLWSRADIVVDKNTKQPFVLEVNRLPGITSKTSDVEGAYIFLSSKIASIKKPD